VSRDDDQSSPRRTTRDDEDRLVFDRSDSRNNNGAKWWERVKRPEYASAERMPTPEQRRTWGNKTSVPVDVNGAIKQGAFQQVVDARFPYPTSWNLGFYMQMQQGAGALDTVVFDAVVVYGHGMTSFTELVSVGSLSTNTSGMIFLPNRPAETITINGIWALTPGDGTPHQNVLTFGALVAPEVYI
jgi:hypothetical protein